MSTTTMPYHRRSCRRTPRAAACWLLGLQAASYLAGIGGTINFAGATATSVGRLPDSKPLRKWVVDHPDEDLSVAISDRLHSFVVAEGVPGLASEEFTQIRVRIKELTTDAWLWTGR